MSYGQDLVQILIGPLFANKWDHLDLTQLKSVVSLKLCFYITAGYGRESDHVADCGNTCHIKYLFVRLLIENRIEMNCL